MAQHMAVDTMCPMSSLGETAESCFVFVQLDFWLMIDAEGSI